MGVRGGASEPAVAQQISRRDGVMEAAARMTDIRDTEVVSTERPSIELSHVACIAYSLHASSTKHAF